MWLKERGFKMNNRNLVKDAQKWSELDALLAADKLISERKAKNVHHFRKRELPDGIIVCVRRCDVAPSAEILCTCFVARGRKKNVPGEGGMRTPTTSASSAGSTGTRATSVIVAGVHARADSPCRRCGSSASRAWTTTSGTTRAGLEQRVAERRRPRSRRWTAPRPARPGRVAPPLTRESVVDADRPRGHRGRRVRAVGCSRSSSSCSSAAPHRRRASSRDWGLDGVEFRTAERLEVVARRRACSSVPSPRPREPGRVRHASPHARFASAIRVKRFDASTIKEFISSSASGTREERRMKDLLYHMPRPGLRPGDGAHGGHAQDVPRVSAGVVHLLTTSRRRSWSAP